MRSICTMAIAGAGALALPAGASAATAALDLPCYVSGQPGNVALAGYAPNAAVNLVSADLGTKQVMTDATGSVTVPFTPPSGNTLKKPGSRTFAIVATEVANPASTSTAAARVAPFAFATDGGTKSPKATRSWYFSGFVAGKPIYAHFRFKARTKGTYRFGVAKAPCGEYKRRAPGIAIKGLVSPGKWTIQIDQSKAYKATTKPSLKDTTVVFTTYRRRAVELSAAILAPGWALRTLAAWR